MNFKQREPGQHIGIFLPVDAGAGALVGLAFENLAVFAALGAGAGMALAFALVRSTSSDDIP